MGFFQELVKPENLALAATGGLSAGIGRAALYNNPAGAAGTTDRSPRYNKLNPSDNYGLGTDIASPSEYLAALNQAYSDLGQPGTDTDREGIAKDWIRGLSSSFVDRIHQKSGRVPTVDQVRQFVAQNATSGNAAKFIQGQISPDQMNALADNYISGNPEVLADPNDTPESRIKALKGELDKAYGAGKESLTSGIEDIYGQQKRGLVDDLAGQGMLTQPTSRISLDALEANKNKSLASGLSSLEGSRAAGQLDLSKTIEGLLQNERTAATGRSQWNQEFNARQDDTAFNRGLLNRQLSLSQELGKMQAKAKEPNWLDYANLALNGAKTASSVYTGFKG
jgi:hypothetical protein